MFSFITISTEPRNFLLLDAVPRRVILVENGCKLRIDFISLCQAQIILYYWKSPTGKNRTGKIYQIGKLAPTASFSGEFRKMRAAVDLCRRSLSRSVWRSGRFYCTEQSSRVKIFDRDLKRKQRDRAAWLLRSDDSLVDAVAENLLDRLEDCTKTFPSALCMGGSMAAIRRLLKGRGGIEKLLMMDASVDMVKLCQQAEQNVTDKNVETSFVVGDEEFLPVKESSMDLVISCLGLHWTNDLLGAMIQSRLALKPDGLFLGAILGGETLRELRIACTVAQMEREGGISPRLSPLAQVRDAGNLLTRAGFTLPGVDVDEYTVRYNSALELIEHLRTMGETNALFQRSQSLKRDTALATAAIYESMFGAEDGTIPATFQVIFMTGWREHPSQQQAKKRGSATVSFKDIHKQFGEAGSVWKMHHWNEQRKVRAFYDMLDRGEISVIAA